MHHTPSWSRLINVNRIESNLHRRQDKKLMRDNLPIERANSSEVTPDFLARAIDNIIYLADNINKDNLD